MKTKTAILASILIASSLTFAASNEVATQKTQEVPAQGGEAAPKEKGAPLPLLTLDGVGGVVLTPIAYLINPCLRSGLLTSMRGIRMWKASAFLKLCLGVWK